MGRGPDKHPREMRPVRRCAHCNRRLGPHTRYAGFPLCYPDSPQLTACYKRVAAGEPLGRLLKVRPLPPGMEDLRREMADAP